MVSFLNSLTKITNYRIVARQRQFNISDVIVNVPFTATSYNFPFTLEEFTHYSCSVYSKSSFGFGDPSSGMEFTTLQDGKVSSH